MIPPPRYSFIVPSRGDRPLALGLALDSVLCAVAEAKLPTHYIEILVGFDGLRGERVRQQPCIRYFDLPPNHDYGNGLRQALLKASHGSRLIFLDDDNALTPHAFRVYEQYPHAEILIARVDMSKAHAIAYLPQQEEGKHLIRPCNIDPLCLCLSRDLVVTRCGGWQWQGYEADYRNILHYSRRAASIEVSDEIVGIYDAGCGLDGEKGRNFRQVKGDK